MLVKLQHVAHVRSGDKGNTSNIGVIAYADELYPTLKTQLTAELVAARMAPLSIDSVVRYEVDGLILLNYVIVGALGGGVSRSLAIDCYGKALSSALLSIPINVDDELLSFLVGY